MRIALLVLFLWGGVTLADGQTAARPAPADANGGFELDLAAPDRLIVMQGDSLVRKLWARHVLTAHRSLVVLAGPCDSGWMDPLLQLRLQRPEVAIEVIADRATLGANGEIGDALANAGIVVHFTTVLGSMAGFAPFPGIRGLLLVRDDSSVLLIMGVAAAAKPEGWTQAWLIESPPAAKAEAARLAALAPTLPAYPAMRQLVLNEH